MTWKISYYQRKKSLRDKFWEKVDIKRDNDCWVWMASINRKGYGNFYISTGNSEERHTLAHRFSWEDSYGLIPDGMYVCHKCDNPSCVNPSHLFLGTNQDNMDDMKRKGRSPRMKGSTHPESKLTESKVQEIKEIRKTGKPYNKIAALYGVDTSLIFRICKGKSWRHTNDE